MKKILSFFAVAAMLSLAFSCTKPEPENPDKPGPDPGPDQPTADAITEITATLDGAGIKTAWAAGDVIFVYAVTDAGDVEAKYVIDGGAGTANGTFKVEGDAPKTGASAYYASTKSLDFAQHNTFSFTLDAEQTGANPVFGTTTDGKAYKFSSPLAGIEFKLTGKGNAAKINIDDKNANNILNGNAEFNAKTGKLKMKNGSAAKNSVAKAFDAVALSDQPVSFFMEVPAEVLETGADITVYNPANGAIGKAEIPAQTLKAGVITSIAVTLEAVSSVADLSATESANCYMITEPGTYKFKTKKGNTNDGIGSAASAEILWETYNNMEEVVPNSIIADVSYANEYVTFKTPETLKKGNAVIAVKDDAGTILWSWHIWVVADMVIDGTTLGYENTELPAGTLMNYNLGAIGEPGTVEAYGFLYAWGRKDPFVSTGELGGSEFATVAGTACTTTPEQGFVTEDFVIQNPTVWVLVSGSDGFKDWTDAHDNTRWNSEKGMFDPCPPGWKVPSTDDTGFLSDSYTKNEEGTIIYFNKDYPMPYTRDKAYTDGHISSDGKYWTCEASGDDYGYGYRLSSNSAAAIRRKAEGNSVRCVKVVAAE